MFWPKRLDVLSETSRRFKKRPRCFSNSPRRIIFLPRRIQISPWSLQALSLKKNKGVKFLVILVRHQSTFSLSTDYYDTWGCFSLSLLVMHPYDKRWQAFSASRVIGNRWLSTHSAYDDKYDKRFHTFRKNAMDEISWIYFAKTLDKRYSRFVYLRT